MNISHALLPTFALVLGSMPVMATENPSFIIIHNQDGHSFIGDYKEGGNPCTMAKQAFESESIQVVECQPKSPQKARASEFPEIQEATGLPGSVTISVLKQPVVTYTSIGLRQVSPGTGTVTPATPGARHATPTEDPDLTPQGPPRRGTRSRWWRTYRGGSRGRLGIPLPAEVQPGLQIFQGIRGLFR